MSGAAREQLADIVAQLREARRAHGDLSQAHLAKLLGVAPGSVVDWEVGRDSPTMANFINWARELQLRLAITDAAGHELIQPYDLTIKEPWAARERQRLAFTLHAARQRTGLSQAALATTLGVGRWSLTQWEGGKMNPRLIGLIAWTNTQNAWVRLRPITR